MPSFLDKWFKRSVPLEEQLTKLAGCGIRLRSDSSVAALLAQFDRKFYEAEPYKRLLPILGEQNLASGERFSDDILMLDTECVEGDGSYVRILQPMVDMTRGALPLTDLKDSIEDQSGSWVQFRLRGRTQRWSVEINEDWIDPTILGRMSGLLAQQKTNLQYVFESSGGQTALIVCSTPANTEHLNAITGMNFKPLGSSESIEED